MLSRYTKLAAIPAFIMLLVLSGCAVPEAWHKDGSDASIESPFLQLTRFSYYYAPLVINDDLHIQESRIVRPSTGEVLHDYSPAHVEYDAALDCLWVFFCDTERVEDDFVYDLRLERREVLSGDIIEVIYPFHGMLPYPIHREHGQPYILAGAYDGMLLMAHGKSLFVTCPADFYRYELGPVDLGWGPIYPYWDDDLRDAAVQRQGWLVTFSFRNSNRCWAIDLRSRQPKISELGPKTHGSDWAVDGRTGTVVMRSSSHAGSEFSDELLIFDDSETPIRVPVPEGCGTFSIVRLDFGTQAVHIRDNYRMENGRNLVDLYELDWRSSRDWKVRLGISLEELPKAMREDILDIVYTPQHYDESGYSVGFMTSSGLLAVGCSNWLAVWDVDKGEPVWKLGPDPTAKHSLAGVFDDHIIVRDEDRATEQVIWRRFRCRNGRFTENMNWPETYDYLRPEWLADVVWNYPAGRPQAEDGEWEFRQYTGDRVRLLQEERWKSGGYDWNGGTFGFHHNKVYCSYKGAVTRSAVIRNDWEVVCTFGDKWLLCAGSRNDLYVVRTGTR